ncbi:MAG: hypothetical protein E7037_05540 [Verrucomicrobia bacterium]|nr:hypothetical protein [Verrucomicrobiota bacterium]
MEEQDRQKKICELRDIFYAELGETYIGLNFKINGKAFWLTGFWASYIPIEYKGKGYFYQTTGHEDDPDTKLIRVFKDKFDMFENFVVDGKNLRQWIETGEVDFIDYNE